MEKYKGTAIGFDAVDLTGGFWKEKQTMARNVTIGAVYDRFEETGRFGALRGDWKEGDPFRPHIFWESDVTKWIEGASYFLSKKRDPKLEEKIDRMADQMEKNQDANGYLNIYFTVVEPDARFTRRCDHELYCAGHLTEGALAYYQATGKRKLLDVAIRYIDHIDQVFRIEHSAAFDTPGHEEIELALVKLYRFTGEQRYKELAEYFINTRGTSPRDVSYESSDLKYLQSHLPVREQTTAVGHAVRAVYLYSAMADLALLDRDDTLVDACRALFENITERRMHITGGIGSTHRGEAFTYDYDLPEYTTYNETCASIGLAMFCRRMLLIEPDGRYADCAERAIYNTILGGISLSGDRFFYENPIAADPRQNAFNDDCPKTQQQHLPILERVRVFDCSCCPPNLIRFIGSIADYMYSVSENTIYAHCYMNGDVRIPWNGSEILLSQQTEYPYSGEIQIRTDTPGSYSIALHIPGWCRKFTLTVNGQTLPCQMEKGYALIERSWEKGDRINLLLSMPAELIESNPQNRSACGRAAVTRGPLVYCAEGIDNPEISLRDVRLDRKASFTAASEEICGTMLPVLYTEGTVRRPFQELYRPCQEDYERVRIKLIPYFAWANRGVTEMTVWMLL